MGSRRPATRCFKNPVDCILKSIKGWRIHSLKFLYKTSRTIRKFLHSVSNSQVDSLPVLIWCPLRTTKNGAPTQKRPTYRKMNPGHRKSLVISTMLRSHMSSGHCSVYQKPSSCLTLQHQPRVQAHVGASQKKKRTPFGWTLKEPKGNHLPRGIYNFEQPAVTKRGTCYGAKRVSVNPHKEEVPSNKDTRIWACPRLVGFKGKPQKGRYTELHGIRQPHFTDTYGCVLFCKGNPRGKPVLVRSVT